MTFKQNNILRRKTCEKIILQSLKVQLSEPGSDRNLSSIFTLLKSKLLFSWTQKKNTMTKPKALRRLTKDIKYFDSNVAKKNVSLPGVRDSVPTQNKT